jgi:PEP-CTERM motif
MYKQKFSRLGSPQALSAVIAMAALCAISSPASATTVYWTDWTSATNGVANGAAAGTITTNTGPLGVTYSGEVEANTTINGTAMSGYPSWTPTGTWADGVNVNDAPNFRDIIAQWGAPGAGTNTITFSVPVVDPIMAIWSLGNGGDNANYTFNASEPYTILAGGPSAEYGGTGLVPNGAADSVTGSEGNGTLQFLGTFSSITFTNTNYEYWYGFTIGVDAIAPPSNVPEPITLSLFGAGLAGAAAMRRRKKANKA